MTYLIIRGASTTDDLSYYGLPVASRYAQAETVILVGRDNSVNFSKGSVHPLTKMEFLDLEDNLNEFGLILEKIRNAHQAFQPGSKLSHCFVGQWLFNWPNGDEFNYQLMVQRNLDRLRESADEFIEREFGMSSTPTLHPDGTKRTYSQTTSVSVDGGSG